MDLYSFLAERFPGLDLERDFSFARHTTIGCGGTASVAASPADSDEAAELLGVLRRAGIPHCYLGAGANVLPPDGEYDGVVVRFRRMNRLYADGELVCAGAGVTGGALLRFAAAARLGGFEPLTGIPMTVGGATAMNAGVRDRRLCELVERVVGVEDGKIRVFSASECGFSEKSSIFLGGIAVTGVYLRGTSAFARNIEMNACRYRMARRSLPRGRSMGCVFVNPEGQSAGALIEACGLKNARVGGAVVSGRHANFILNEGGTASEVAALVDLVRKTVLEKTGVSLREEIRRIGAIST